MVTVFKMPEDYVLVSRRPRRRILSRPQTQSSVNLMFLIISTLFIALSILTDDIVFRGIFVIIAISTASSFVLMAWFPRDEDYWAVNMIAFSILILFIMWIGAMTFVGAIILYIGGALWGWPFSWGIALAIGFIASLILGALAID